MRSVELNVSRRDPSVKAAPGRRAGRIPGVVYGAGGPNLSLEVDAHEFAHSGLRGHGSTLIAFRSSDSELNKGLALVKEIQVHPVSGAPLHLDFLRVDESKPVGARVSLNYVGKAVGVTEGGMLQPVRRDLEIRALPSNLPAQIEVDVTGLGIHDSLHVADLQMPEGVEALFSENFTLVTVLPPVVHAAEAEGEEEAAATEAAEAETGENTAAEDS